MEPGPLVWALELAGVEDGVSGTDLISERVVDGVRAGVLVAASAGVYGGEDP